MHTEESVAAAVEDYDRVMASGGPDDTLLASAPLLDRYVIEPYAGLRRLAGYVSGHPSLRDGERIATSLLLAIDRRRRWARTLSRWYRLGNPR